MTAPLPSRAPVPHPTRRVLGRVALRNCLVTAAALVLLIVLLTGCGTTPAPAAAPSTMAPTGTTPTPPPQPTTGPTTAPDPAAPAPIWPASDAASAQRLQQSVDDGSQPWLLDPVEVATSYAGSQLGYGSPEAVPRGPGTVDVTDGSSPGTATITLAQTVRRGDGGIWLVTGAQRR